MRDGKPEVVTATVDGVAATKAGNVLTITVPVTKAYKSIGEVVINFTEEVKIKSVKIGETSYLSEVTTKFGDNKTNFTATVLTNFVNLVKKGTSVTVVVTGAGGDSTFTVNLVVDDVVTVEKLGAKVAVDEAGVFEANEITLEEANTIFSDATIETVFIVEINETDKFELVWKAAGNEFANNNIQFEGLTIAILKNAVVKVKP